VLTPVRTYAAVVDPILHLSLPVRDLDESRAFYVDLLGCELGRVRDGWIDVWFYGMQVTLHEEPDLVAAPGGDPLGVRHFGVTLAADQLDAVVRRLESQTTGRPIEWLRPLATQYAGTPRAQTKAMIVDPSGNAIELKSYADPSAAFSDR
jgi:extradiol dioxygenase family protein